MAVIRRGRVEVLGALRCHRRVVVQPAAVGESDLECPVGVQGEAEVLLVDDGVS